MIKLKKGVSVSELKPQMLIVLQIADCIYKKHGQDCIVTSGNDGLHKMNSLHYTGYAVDLRTRCLQDRETEQNVAAELAAALGAEFDIVLEKNHLHIEYDPE